MDKMYSHVLIDGDIVASKACFVSQTSYYHVFLEDDDEIIYSCKTKKEASQWSEGIEEVTRVVKQVDVMPLPIVYKIVDNLIEDILKTLNLSTYTIYIAPPGGVQTYRHRAAKKAPYKGNRKAEDRPVQIREVQEYLIEKYNAIRAVDEETDDLLGLDQCASGGTSIIASIDKDLLQIPGWHYNIDSKKVQFASDPGELQIVVSASGIKKVVGTGFKWFLYQCLAGDSVDNIIKPEKNLGPMKIYELFSQKCAIIDVYNEVLDIYKRNGRDFEENATLLFIQREKGSNWLGALNDIIS